NGQVADDGNDETSVDEQSSHVEHAARSRARRGQRLPDLATAPELYRRRRDPGLTNGTRNGRRSQAPAPRYDPATACLPKTRPSSGNSNPARCPSSSGPTVPTSGWRISTFASTLST